MSAYGLTMSAALLSAVTVAIATIDVARPAGRSRPGVVPP